MSIGKLLPLDPAPAPRAQQITPPAAGDHRSASQSAEAKAASASAAAEAAVSAVSAEAADSAEAAVAGDAAGASGSTVIVEEDLDDADRARLHDELDAADDELRAGK